MRRLKIFNMLSPYEEPNTLLRRQVVAVLFWIMIDAINKHDAVCLGHEIYYYGNWSLSQPSNPPCYLHKSLLTPLLVSGLKIQAQVI